ncbi:MAG: NAD-dependent epimerase/dehydratase family protein [Bryobacteraceae bacterium]|nr:NAD-dependent epimerase/dehydratase family protein [Bryobacteraceae bacterium]
MNYQDSTLFVTGAHGCIGAWIVKLALEGGARVVAFDQTGDPWRLKLIAPDYDSSRLTLATGAIEDTAAVKTLVKDSGVTHICHMAAVLMPYCAANPVSGGLIDVIGTLNVFEAARDSGRDVRITYASSSAVWGPPSFYEDRPLTERDTPQPSTHYGVFKQANEGNARVFFAQNGISSIALRPWTVYGPGRDTGLTADPTLAMRSVAERKPFQIRTTGKMDLQFVEDIAATFLACLYSPLTGAHVFNVAGDIVDMTDLIALFEELRPEARGLITAAGNAVPVAYRMDDAELRARVPGVRRTSLRDGIERTIRFFESRVNPPHI